MADADDEGLVRMRVVRQGEYDALTGFSGSDEEAGRRQDGRKLVRVERQYDSSAPNECDESPEACPSSSSSSSSSSSVGN